MEQSQLNYAKGLMTNQLIEISELREAREVKRAELAEIDRKLDKANHAVYYAFQSLGVHN